MPLLSQTNTVSNWKRNSLDTKTSLPSSYSILVTPEQKAQNCVPEPPISSQNNNDVRGTFQRVREKKWKKQKLCVLLEM